MPTPPFPVLTYKAWVTHTDVYHTCVILVGWATEVRAGMEGEGLRKERVFFWGGGGWAGAYKEERPTPRKLGMCSGDLVVCWRWQLLPAVSTAGCGEVAWFYLRWGNSR